MQHLDRIKSFITKWSLRILRISSVLLVGNWNDWIKGLKAGFSNLKRQDKMKQTDQQHAVYSMSALQHACILAD